MSERTEGDKTFGVDPLGGGTRSFSGIRTLFRLPPARDLDEIDGAHFAAIGLPFDTGTSYRAGARFGPSALRHVSNLIRPYNPALDVSLGDILTGFDLGDAPVTSGNAEASLESMAEAVSRVTEKGILPIGLGGDHTVSLSMLRAVARRYGPVSLLHFDSHPDTWDSLYGERYNHGTPFRRALEENLIDPKGSVQLGIRGSMMDREVLDYTLDAGITMVPAVRMLEMSAEEVSSIVADVVGSSPLFVSFDVDFLDPAFAPGTGTPEIGGPTTAQALSYIRALDLSGLVGVDVVEVLPASDSSDMTALAAVTILHEILCLYARSLP